MSNPKSNRRPKCGGLDYHTLEPRQLLATMVSGTAGNDVVRVDFVDDSRVNITTNGTLDEGIDISDGLKINLQGGNFDQVFVDHRISAEIQMVNVEELTVDGGDNQWKIGSFADLSGEIQVAGRINNNVTFAGVHLIRSGSGADVFTVNTENDFALSIYAGQGDDLFRYSNFRETEISSFASVAATRIAVPQYARRVSGYGEQGNDRYVFRGANDDLAIGGDGYDIVDYRQQENGAFVDLIDLVDGQWNNEKYFGVEGGQNSVAVNFYRDQPSRLEWVIDGEFALVTETVSGQKVNLVHFTEFFTEPSRNSFDQVWILRTAADLRIHNMDWIQIGSDVDLAESTLDSITHDIRLDRTLGHLTLDESELEGFYGVSYGGIQDPIVIISDAAGSGVNAIFNSDRTITGLTDGQIIFGNPTCEDCPSLLAIPIFNPRIRIHGSLTGSDHFVFNSTWTSTQVESYGGNDVFMIGSSNLAADGDLTRIRGELKLDAGSGSDRLFVNHQGHQAGATAFWLTAEKIESESRSPVQFSDIKFNEDLEFARINGAAAQSSEFTVAPSATTRFVVAGSQQPSLQDILRIEGANDQRVLSESLGTGAWQFGGQYQPVYFYGIEDPTQTRDATMVRIAVPELDNGYQQLASAVLKSQTELDALIAEIEIQGNWNQKDQLLDVLNNVVVDFATHNLVFYRNTQTSESIQIRPGIPKLENGNAVVEFDVESPEIGTPDMAFRGYLYQINKSIPKVIFSFPDTLDEIINA